MQKLWAYVRDKVGGHDIDHVRRVYQWAEKIARNIPEVRYNILRPAVILHDICREEEDDDPTGQLDHALLGAERAAEILRAEGFSEPDTRDICACIRTHRYSSDKTPPQSVEAKILFDADKLDVLGAVGVARLFMLSGQYGERLYIPPPEGWGDGARMFRIAELDEYSANLEYLGKMRFIPERLFSPYARAEAQRLLAVMEDFFTRLEEETHFVGQEGLPLYAEPEGAAALTRPVKEPKPPRAVTLYTDGACSGNPGPGGWGAILRMGGHERELSGGERSTTNNRMELMAVIAGLEALREPCEVTLYSDSKYVVDALSKGWARAWQARGWVKSDKKPAQNVDLWERLLALCARHRVLPHWVRGHADN